VHPRVLVTEARIDFLLRRFHRCQLGIDQALRLGRDDMDLRQSCEITTAQLAAARGRPPSLELPIIVPESYLAGSARALRALITAVFSEQPESVFAMTGEMGSKNDFTTIARLNDFARAIAWERATALEREVQPTVSLAAAAERCLNHQDVFAFVAAYRMFSPIIPASLAHPPLTSRVADVVATFDPVLAQAHGIRASAIRPSRVDPLSPRERDVLKLLTEGLTNREIAARLFISEATAKLHVRRICGKLGVRNRTEAALQAVS
jgi:DNA-binding NarL/FixJ family response regulator